MHRWLGRFEPQAYALMRIVAGFLFLFHGAQKLFGAFGRPPATETLMQVGGVIEFVGGILVMIGLFASWAAFLSSGMMAFAYFMGHYKFWDPPEGGLAFWPIQNRGELAVLYCFVFLYIAFRGAGPWSVASLLRKPQLG